MKQKNITTEMIVIMGLMIALEVVLSKVLSINISFLRIGFGFLPIAILAILYGPVRAAIAYGIGDIIGAFLFPTGSFFIGFTISSILTGLILGIVLYGHRITFVRALIASTFVCLFVNLLINTYWLTFFIDGSTFSTLLASRAVKEIVAIPVMAILITVIDGAVVRTVKNRAY